MRLSLRMGVLASMFLVSQVVQAQNRFATSDSLSGYVHWIDLYDASNRKIDPAAENPQPYSPEKTCGRCHEYDTISHGWHFNATDPEASHGRPGQPWIWSDHRTGTHLPLSYRGWEGTYDPDDLGLTRWEVAAKLGGFMPGGGVGSEASMSNDPEDEEKNRARITGALPVDCLMCHHNVGSGYSPFEWTEQIENENFAYAPAAALGIATVEGNMSRLKGDFDPQGEDAQDKLPKIEYDQRRFRGDGKVFIDLIRKPNSDACYYCHTNLSADAISGTRWLHDEDVHLRAGMECADCHRNGLNHDTVRGFQSEQHSSGPAAGAFSCQGCHMGTEGDGRELVLSGRLGAPQPAHRGLPPIHFEKMTCTACHSGPASAESLARQVNSIAHELGKHVKRTGGESPGILASLNLPVTELSDGEHSPVYTPHRLMWSSFWGLLQDGEVTPLNPNDVYDLVRRPLRIRRDFTEELSEVKLSLSQRKEILGDERARVKEEERTEEEQAKIAAAEAEARKVQVAEKLTEALAAIEEANEGAQAVFVSGGMGFTLNSEREVEIIEGEKLGTAVEPYAWPVAHNVRPARQSLGTNGCTECHSDEALYFNTTLTSVGVVPDQPLVTLVASDLQGVDGVRLSAWNQLFAGRSQFKIAGLISLGLTALIVLSSMAWNLASIWRK